MTKIASLDDLKRLKSEIKLKIDQRKSGSTAGQMVQVKVAMATCGIASGAKPVMEFMVQELNKRNINAVVTQTGCMGFCYAEPTIEVTLPGKEPLVFGNVTKSKADEIIETYIKNGDLVDGIIPIIYQTIDFKN
jgi:NADP-reducing hydrogenase subunit HndB